MDQHFPLSHIHPTIHAPKTILLCGVEFLQYQWLLYPSMRNILLLVYEQHDKIESYFYGITQ